MQHCPPLDGGGIARVAVIFFLQKDAALLIVDPHLHPSRSQHGGPGDHLLVPPVNWDGHDPAGASVTAASGAGFHPREGVEEESAAEQQQAQCRQVPEARSSVQIFLISSFRPVPNSHVGDAENEMKYPVISNVAMRFLLGLFRRWLCLIFHVFLFF